jgi:PAS domain S-box-containing protein
MSHIFQVDQTGHLLAQQTGSKSTDWVSETTDRHLAQLFAVAEHYDSSDREKWFAVLCSRTGVPTALTLAGEACPSLVTLRKDARRPGCFEVSIDAIEPEQNQASPLPVESIPLTTAIEHSEVSLFARSLDGRIQMVVGAPANRPQLPTPLAVGESIFDVYPPAMLEKLQETDDQIMRTGEPIRADDHIALDSDGRIFSSTKFPIFDEAGTLVAISGISHDITRHARNLHRLNADQHRITRSILSSSLAVVITTLDGRFTASNSAFTAKYGYSEQSIIGKNAADIGIISQGDQTSLIERLKRDGEVINAHYTLYASTGLPIDVTMNAIVVELDGEPAVINMSADESRAQAAEKQLQLIADASGEGIVLHDGKVMLEANRKACEIYGRDREALIEISIWELIRPDDWATVAESIKSRGPTSYQITIDRPDGAERTLSVRGYEVVDSPHSYRIAVFTDITDEEALKSQLRRAQKMEVLGQLTGGIAHDFNNILASILGFSDLLVSQLQESNNDQHLHWAGQVKAAALKGRDLVAQMLSFSRGGTSQPVPTTAATIVNDVMTMVKASLPANIGIECRTQEVPDILIDPIQFNQVVLNLCINASHAMVNQGGMIIIDISEKHIDDHCSSCLQPISGDYVEISIKDQGSGIEAQPIEKIFEPFFSTKETCHGTGMGLAVIHGILHDCNSHIVVHSYKGRGSAFNVLLPPLATQPINQSTDKAESCSARLVVVDDDKLVADMLCRMLEAQNYQVVSFHHPQQAWDAFNTDGETWDLLITDQNMPGFKGDELARRIRQKSDSLPIIIHTGYSQTLDLEAARELGLELLQKPVEQKILIETISQLLSS